MKTDRTLKLKVCGMREAENITGLIALQPELIGFIFHEPSARFCAGKPEVDIPEEIIRTGVFVNSPLETILQKKEEFGLSLAQLHGKESPEFCRGVRQHIPVMKAFNIDYHFDFQVLEAYTGVCDYFLFDASGPKAGGNGIQFNWDLLQQYQGKTPFFLSGGLSPDSVDALREFQHPALVGIDINSGFEVRPGLKNIEKIKQFKYELSS
ncbi:MAG: phosphoribosylanthranilate isomerase [Bacteroidales bacterium]|nr:phosphoribosylanthranilate isomerase [Bacteroidales bacterium]